ncbi:MAG: response regulator transcription factor [Candidatus Sulfotelmatobacter sp.]
MLPLIFLVDHDRKASNLLARTLKDHHYTVLTFSASQGVISAAEEMRPALFLVNALLPVESGLSLCLAIRRNAKLAQTPVVLMSDRDCEDDRILGLDLGADDFVTKPFGPRELMARVKSVLRRSVYRHARTQVQAGEIAVDTERFTLSVRGQNVAATAIQVRIMEHLVRNEGRVFSRDQILDAVWADARFVTPRTVDVHIHRIREIIELDPANPKFLQTVRGAGYRFTTDDGALQPRAVPTEAWLPAHLAKGSENFGESVSTQSRLRNAS